MNKKIFFSAVLIIAVLFSIISPVFAEPDTIPDIHAQGAVLMDMKTGRIIYSKNPDEKLYPASTTKILTAIIALEECGDSLETVVTASSDAISPITLDDSHMGILIGEQLTVENLINGMLVASANDAANVLAVHISGSLSGFAELMNQKAKAIGAVNSNFVNPHGYHDENHYTTANDLAAIARYAMTNEKISPKFREIVAKSRYIIEPTNKYKETRYLSSTNHLISKIRNSHHFYAPAIGIKTGYTSHAGNCLVAAAKKDDTEILSVLLKCQNEGSGDSAYSFTDTKALFEYAFENYQYTSVAMPGDIVSDSKVEEAKDSVRVALTPKQEIGALLPKTIDLKAEIKVNMDIPEEFTAPIEKGQSLGKAVYSYKGEILGTTEIVAGNAVERDTILFIIHRIVDVVTNPIFYIVLVLIVMIIVILKIKRNKRRKERRRNLRFGNTNRYR